MSITYRPTIDSAYYRTLIDRYYRQRPFLLRLPVQFGLLLIALLGFVVWNPESDPAWKGTLIVLALVWPVVTFLGVSTTKWAILRRLCGKPDFGKNVEMRVSDDGISAGNHHWGWSAYPRSARFPDGILLMRNGAIRWLPDSVILAGSADEATRLVDSRTALRRIA